MSQLLLKSCEEVLVIGCGLMGAGISQVVAQSGYRVTVIDKSERELEKGRKQIEKGLKKLDISVKNEILSRINFSTKLEDGSNCSLAIEAIPENLEMKLALFRKLEQLLKQDSILASNTSSLSISAMSAVTSKPDRVIGLHFFSPVPVMKLVEVVHSMNTSKETVNWAINFGKSLGKETILSQDYPGFIVNRMLVPMLNEAAFLVLEGHDPINVDQGMKLGANHPIGPLKLADMVGLDVLLNTLESLYDGFNDSKFRPCPLLKRMVEAGHLGKKSGRGFFSY